MVSAGWFDDPATPDRERYWDGTQWTSQVRPKAASAPPPFAAPTPFAAPGPVPPDGDSVFARPSLASAGPEAPPYPRASVGQKVGMVVGSVVGVGLVAFIAVTVFGPSDDSPPRAAADSASPVASAPPAPAPAPAPQADQSVPGAAAEAELPPPPKVIDPEYAVPEGFVVYDDVTPSIEFAVPPEWLDRTEEARPSFDFGDAATPEGMMTFLGAWSSVDEPFLPDAIWAVRIDTSADQPLSTVIAQERKAAPATFGTVEWTTPQGFVADTGQPVLWAVGVPQDPDVYGITMWVVGGPHTKVLVECIALDMDNGCNDARRMVDTIWIEP